jgi:hypothetical protein
MRRTPSFLLCLTIASVLTPAVALAQMTPTPEPTSRATMTSATTGNGRGFGLGAVAFFQPFAGGVSNTVPNLLLTWGDAHGRFHVDGLFGLYHNTGTDFDLAARGWYHVHAASSADFSVGAGLGFTRRRNNLPAGQTSAQWDFEMELGAQVRAFIVSNVALLGSVGLGLYIPDTGNTVVNISGNLTGTVGLAYYFQ